VSAKRDEYPRLEVLLWRLKTVWLVLIVVGAWGAVLARWRTGGYLMLGGVVAQISTNVVVGVSGYRRVMSRPWPKVEPLPDDDWGD